MATFNFTSSEGQSNRPPLINGLYTAEITDVEEKISKNGNDMFNIKLTIYHEGYTYYIWDSLVFTEKAFWKISQLWKALGNTPLDGENITITPLSIQSKKVDVETELQPSRSDHNKLEPKVRCYRQPIQQQWGKPASAKPSMPLENDDDIPF